MNTEERNKLKLRISERLNSRDNEPKLNGMKCPKCESELMDTNPLISLMSNPPKKNIHCSNSECDYRGYRLA